jgi:hypothetical protein
MGGFGGDSVGPAFAETIVEGRPSLHRSERNRSNRKKHSFVFPAVQIPIGAYSPSGSTCPSRALPIKDHKRK